MSRPCGGGPGALQRARRGPPREMTVEPAPNRDLHQRVVPQPVEVDGILNVQGFAGHLTDGDPGDRK
jgi:hypothetical protein